MNPRAAHILLLDDDLAFVQTLAEHLQLHGLQTATATSIRAAQHLVKERFFSIVIADQNLPDGDGIGFARELIDSGQGSKVILVTAFAEIARAVEAMQVGVFDYLQKPIDLAELDVRMQRALRTAELESNEQLSQYKSNRECESATLVGNSAATMRLREQLEVAAEAYPTPVFITGETGVGKGLAARIIHRSSAALRHRMITLNCAAVTASMYEAELFGHERGAFTGAYQTRRGVFELSDAGTLILDEIGEVPLEMQPKMLRVLDEGKVRRVGGEIERNIKLGVIAITNRDVEAMVKKQSFREDLYYRLAVIRIEVPPLRQRADDIDRLVEFFFSQQGVHVDDMLDDDELDMLRRYTWPGNVRELKNVLERVRLFRRHGRQKSPLPLVPLLTGSSPDMTRHQRIDSVDSPQQKPCTLQQLEREHILRTLQFVDDNKSAAAAMLGISRSTLKRKLRLLDASNVSLEHDA